MKRDETYLSPEHAAARMGRSLATIWRYARARLLEPVTVLGRTKFRLSQIEALLAPERRRSRIRAAADD